MKEDIKQAISYKSLDLNDYDDHSDLYDALSDDGTIHEIIDGMIDIYYYDLRKWAVDSYEYAEQAIEEGFIDMNNFDYHKAIQCGQYIYWQEESFDMVRTVFDELKKYELSINDEDCLYFEHKDDALKKAKDIRSQSKDNESDYFNARILLIDNESGETIFKHNI